MEIDKLARNVKAILQNQEVVVTAFLDGNKQELHLRKGKVIRMKASLKRLDWNHKRDFVGLGGDGDEVVEEFRTITLLAESTPGWKFIPVQAAGKVGDRWRQPDFNDRSWRSGKAPIGYGEPELTNRKGTLIQEQGQPFYFRRSIEVASDLLSQKKVTFTLRVASDDSADVWINGQLADQEPPGTDHEFAYWNREVEIPAKLLKAGRNVIAVVVRNHQGSSDLYFDMEVTAQIPIPRPPRKSAVSTKPTTGDKPVIGDPLKPPVGDPKDPSTLTVDKGRRAVIVPVRIAPRKLPNLNEIYPLEVVASYPAPRGQKAHETVVSFTDIRPSDIHKALEGLGLKPGKPARGEAGTASGPEVRLLLEFTGSDGKVQTLPIEKLMADRRNGNSLPPLRWIFTGSTLKQPDPEKDNKVYGADMTGTLIALFPVTDDTVFQSNLTMKEEGMFKLEVVKNLLPKEGTPVKLIIQAK